MRTYLLSFVMTAVLSALFTPIVLRLALRIGAVSTPGGRNVNARTIPRLGGIAIAASCACTLLMLLRLDSSVGHILQTAPLKVLGLLGGALIVFVVGALDDTRRVRALYKLYAQLAAATLAYVCGFRIDHVSWFGANQSLSMGVFGFPVTILWIVGVVNAINLIDGLDGLAGGIVFFAGVTNFVVAYLGGDVLLSVVMAVMIGGVLGFLFFNFNPARIFMGDSGSYFLGFLLGTSALSGHKASTAVSLLVPVLAMGVPIFDTLFTMLRRFLERRPIFSPDRGHIHHRLLDMGLTHRRAVLILYGVSMVFTVAALAVSFGHDWQAAAAIFIASVVAIGLFRATGYFDYLVRLNRQKVRVRVADTEKLRRAVPRLLRALGESANEPQVWSSVEEMLRSSGFANAELRGDSETPSRTWIIEPGLDRDEVVSASFPVGPDSAAQSTIVFRWQTEEKVVNPQSEILLQVAVDALADALTRLQSRSAPQLAGAVRTPSKMAPSALDAPT
jgi:UDP-GlcNAc:undecaprenyl-phosphate GlcNAc-1-phosphate transferase